MPHLRTPPKYITQGFVPTTLISGLGVIYGDQASVAIDKGDVLFDDGAGFLTNVGTAFAATFRGIAHETSDLSAGSDGDDTIAYIPAAADVQYWVKDSVQLLTQTIVGALIELGDNDSVDSSDTSLVEWGFLVDEIDVSTDAVAANTQGFALGRFQKTPQ